MDPQLDHGLAPRVGQRGYRLLFIPAWEFHLRSPDTTAIPKFEDTNYFSTTTKREMSYT